MKRSARLLAITAVMVGSAIGLTSAASATTDPGASPTAASDALTAQRQAQQLQLDQDGFRVAVDRCHLLETTPPSVDADNQELKCLSTVAKAYSLPFPLDSVMGG